MKTNKTVLFPLLLLWYAFPSAGQGHRQNTLEQEKTFRLGGHLPQLGNDTLVLKLWPDLLYYGALSLPQITQKVVANQGHFQFSLPAPERPFYYSLYQVQKDSGELIPFDLLSYYIGERGDDITVSEKEGRLHFKGAGARKVSIQYTILKQDTAFRLAYAKKAGPSKEWNDDALPKKIKTFSVPLLKQKLAVLNQNKRALSVEVWGMLKADVLAENIQGRMFFLQNGITGPSERLEKYRRYCNEFVDDLFRESIPDGAKARSRLYAPFLLEHELLEARLKKAALQGPELYQAVTKGHEGELSDRLRTELVLRYYPKSSQAEIYMNAALQEVTTPYCRDVLLNLFSRSQKGKTIYSYPFKDSASKTIYLSDFRGRLVFVDVWYVGCGGCYTFYQNSLKKVEEHFKNQPDIVFVSICADANRSKWLKAVRRGDYTSAGMINLTAEGFDHPFLKYYNVHTFPFQILLDREGKISRIDDLQKKPEELIEILNSYLRP